ncbi:translation initiation factor eIF3 alpha subunit [Schizosaccharomyces cryophilus OY26]|uniref:Translation initiation factor eIF3 alpha subunit n=1 Tax=Schizosaccharomyces cryophilus (strain OY26 / ATCC MYA-4695 / CBS 11777 / NBRC 106824 / NRRL Y48691) TaxID=653667 RepID=S9VTU4_SCHCR|nr:translation initiation factor eIF3 alpha subunit [Schizosaccharomyces cryophilus OY26]EPY49490.1 translation initiation factor eIF3 alpha subunit [Schizosaccharomyces cryophilus OY26]
MEEKDKYAQENESVPLKQTESTIDPDAEVTIDIRFPDRTPTLSFSLPLSSTIHDVRQVILELLLAPTNTCFHLAHENEKLQPFAELHEIQTLESLQKSETLVFDVVLDPYTERDARFHIFTLLDFLDRSNRNYKSDNFGIRTGFCMFPEMNNPTESYQMDAAESSNSKFSILNKDFWPDNTHPFHSSYEKLLSPMLPSRPFFQHTCFRSFSLSAWNPVPPEYAMQGHLLYLSVTTLEGQLYHITSHVAGYFVNKSTNTRFDPTSQGDLRSHSLISLLCQLSPLFKENLEALLDIYRQQDQLAFARISGSIPQAPWITMPAQNIPNLKKTQEAQLNPYIENQGNLRDWNEEIQSAREMAHESIQDRVLRERLLMKTLQDFTEVSVQGAIEIVNGNIPSLNPLEPEGSRMYVHNNIFFSFGRDSVGIFKKHGGDAAAYYAVGKDATTIRLINQLDVVNLSSLGTCIVDYAGHRIVAQTIIPGIFKQLELGSSQLIYGSVEGEEKFRFDSSLEPELLKLANTLHIKKHNYKDQDGSIIPLYTSLDTKGLLGSDGRKYVMDLYSLFPPDLGFLNRIERNSSGLYSDYPHRLVQFRPELIQSFWENSLNEETEEKVGSSEDKDITEQLKKTVLNQNGTGVPEASQIPLKTKKKVAQEDCLFNPNVFHPAYKYPENEEGAHKDDIYFLEKVSSYLSETVIPQFIDSICNDFSFMPIDGIALSRALHRNGINIRYLGDMLYVILDKYPENTAMIRLFTSEIFARSAKHLIRAYISKTPRCLISHVVSHFFNCLLAESEDDQSFPFLPEESISQFYPETCQMLVSMSPKLVSEALMKESQSRFGYKIPREFVKEVNQISLIRLICLKLGIQLACKDYVSKGENTEAHDQISDPKSKRNKKKKKEKKAKQIGYSERVNSFHKLLPQDILNLAPVVKSTIPYSALAQESLDACKVCLLQENKDLCYDLLNESLSLHEQIYGVFHPEIARAYCQLAMICHQLGKKEESCSLGRKALVVCERILGFDSSETILAYLNLALYEFSHNRISQALVYSQYALQLWHMVFGTDHPNMITSYTNIGLMLRSMKLLSESKTCIKWALDLCQKFQGKTSTTAALTLQYAQALALTKDLRQASQEARAAYKFYEENLGSEHNATKEAEHWLSQLIASAVKQEKVSRQ